MMTAGAPPPAAVIEGMEALGFHITHVYGLTEVYGPAVVCAWHDEWDALPAAERARLKARQGVTYPVLEGLTVADPATLAPVAADGATMGEVLMRGNIVMKGYLKNPNATEEAFAGGWFHSGDLGVMHPDGYIELKDRSKDIIISGGENISTIEVEDVLYRHPAVLEAAVVARPDPMWGETPCAFVTLKPEAAATAEDIIAFCRGRLARFKAPRTVIFGPLPKTSTGKIQKFLLRERAKAGRFKSIRRLKQKAGGQVLARLWGSVTERLRSVPLELADLVLYAELLTLQVVDRVLVGKGTLVLLIEGAFERGVLFLERLDAILQRHARSSC